MNAFKIVFGIVYGLASLWSAYVLTIIAAQPHVFETLPTLMQNAGPFVFMMAACAIVVLPVLLFIEIVTGDDD